LGGNSGAIIVYGVDSRGGRHTANEIANVVAHLCFSPKNSNLELQGIAII
jgi:hypothetical protein